MKNESRAVNVLKIIGMVIAGAAGALLLAGIFGFIMKENIFKEFSYGSLILAIGLLGYLKLQIEMYENHQKSNLKKSNKESS